MRRLQFSSITNWSLVATSCVEAGVDMSFRTAFRERFAAASIVQTGGRVNRHGEFDAAGGAMVYDFALDGPNVTQHPAARVSADVLRRMLEHGKLNKDNPSDVVTEAMRDELTRLGGLTADPLLKAESERNYPLTEQHGRVITADTRLVVIDTMLKQLLSRNEKVSYRGLLAGSVQLWSNRVQDLGLEPIWPGADIYSWEDAYDPDFIGYMEGVLRLKSFVSDGGMVI